MTRSDSIPSKSRRALMAFSAVGILACFPSSGAAQGEIPPPENPAADTSIPGRVLFSLRPMFTYIDQANRPLRAQASNMRTLLGYRSAPFDEFEFTGQIVDVSWLHPMRASNQPGSPSPYPLVLDPEKSDLNLLFADYAGLQDTRIRFGRQAITLDNGRFVDDADVRQMPQVFDAISVRNRSLPNTEIFAARAWHVRTFIGNRVQTGTTLLNARVQLESGPSLGAYSYFQDQAQTINQTGFSDNSNRIIGARVEGNHPVLGGTKWYYTAEAAQQRPFASGDNRIRATYQRLALGPSWSSYSAQLGYERLGSNGGLYGFQTPLSYTTAQGYAYAFFTIPASGLLDFTISGGAKWDRLSLLLKYHQFKADVGGAAYGNEQDLVLAYRATESVSIRAVFARFHAAAGFAQPSADRYYINLQYDF
jgi:Alginate export